MTVTQLERIAAQFKEVMDSHYSDVLKMSDLHALRDEMASYEGDEPSNYHEEVMDQELDYAG